MNRRLFGRSGFSINIPWNWRQICKRTSLSRPLKEYTICNLYGWRFGSLYRIRRTLLSDTPHAWACLLANRHGLRSTNANTRAVFSGVRTQEGRPGGFYTRQSLLHATALHIDRLHLEMGLNVDSFHGEIQAGCLFNGSRPNKQFHSTHTHTHTHTHTRSVTPQRSMSTNFEGHCFS